MIYRKEINFATFFAPRVVTLGYQRERKAFSVWFNCHDARHECHYKLVPTGDPFDPNSELVASCVMDDGFTVFHLIRLEK